MLRETDSLFSSGHAGGEWVTAYCDGGSRGNPGPAGYGVFVEDADGNRLAELSEYLGKATNNVAEYSALLAALEWALRPRAPAAARRGRFRAAGEADAGTLQGCES